MLFTCVPETSSIQPVVRSCDFFWCKRDIVLHGQVGFLLLTHPGLVYCTTPSYFTLYRGGYCDEGVSPGLVPRATSDGFSGHHVRVRSNGSAHHAKMASNDSTQQHHQRKRSAMKHVHRHSGGSDLEGASRHQSLASSVRLEDEDDDARSIMDAFQHRCVYFVMAGSFERFDRAFRVFSFLPWPLQSPPYIFFPIARAMGQEVGLPFCDAAETMYVCCMLVLCVCVYKCMRVYVLMCIVC